MAFQRAPVTSDPVAVTGWLNFSPTQSTTSIAMGATANGITGGVTGKATMIYTEAQSDWVQFSIPVNYDIGNDDPAGSITISFMIADSEPAGALGSWFQINDIGFDGAQGLAEMHSSISMVGMPYPSTFSHSTMVPVTLQNSSAVNANVLDLLGRSVDVIKAGTLGAGEHKLTWTPSAAIPNGIYFIRMSRASGPITRRVVLDR